MHSSELQDLPSPHRGHPFFLCTLRAGPREHSFTHHSFPASDPIIPSLGLPWTLSLLPGV